ncbi:glycosyltransferase family 4 protein [Enterococcus faecium]|uniref:glycosyltransferase family 4 protein n=1 Tax=Enterococcus faecium TaxID=1352 RepID=UPI001883488E|nr:glycosyltransferase family 4 protein [Enterococcus faecium]MBE9857950.1 glycosyltransferase family 4 protein [Enterococcus faecium]MBE9881999.1 glycosyltransferase family 4 protein [Enterococcus faecium]
MKKIAFVTYDRTPYRILQLNEYTKSFEITAYYNAVSLKNRDWNLPNSKFTEKKINGIIKFRNRYLINFGIKELVESNDIIMVGGYDSPSSLYICLMCKLMKKDYCITMDGISPSKIENKNTLKYLLKKLIIKNAKTFFANGLSAKEYLINEFNVDKSRIYNQYLAVDNDGVQEAKRLKLSEPLYRVFKESNKYKLIYSGRLLEGKNVPIILDAINKIENKNEYTLIILGDGPEKEKILKKSKLYEIDTKITGFIEEQSQLFSAYYKGDILILPSKDDSWGLVVNEAMAAGLPIIASKSTGSAKDLILDGINGYTFNADEADELAKAIEKVYKVGERKMGKESGKIINNWNFSNSLKSLSNMINVWYK